MLPSSKKSKSLSLCSTILVADNGRIRTLLHTYDDYKIYFG